MSGRQQRVMVQPIVCPLLYSLCLRASHLAMILECHFQKSSTSEPIVYYFLKAFFFHFDHPEKQSCNLAVR